MRSVIRFPNQRFTVATLCNGDHLPPGTLGEQVAALTVRGAEQILKREVNAGVHAELLTRLKAAL